ncbi:sigma-E processing peptidase SpoIIGA [Oscillospiraceae bacterium LTW-04]|nr:sigma-E processing peptidase SpoIIGA [Oscillospiraceae bacterium MB24-C1]
MPTVVYVDVLLVINFMVNFILLRITALFIRRQPVFWRLCLAAVLGAFGALIIFVPVYNRAVLLLYKLFLTVMMSVTAFGCKGFKRVMMSVFCLFTVSLLTSGLLLLLSVTMRPRGMLVSKGAVYLDIGAAALIGCCIAAYLIAGGLSSLLARGSPKGTLCEITVLHAGAVSVFPALVDTGSNLTEPFSHCPVIVCEEQALGSAMPPELKNFSLSKTPGQGLRLIPYKTLDSSGLLPAFMPDTLLVRPQGESARKAGDCYIAVLDKSLGSADYRAVCNPQMLIPNFNLA